MNWKALFLSGAITRIFAASMSGAPRKRRLRPRERGHRNCAVPLRAMKPRKAPTAENVPLATRLQHALHARGWVQDRRKTWTHPDHSTMCYTLLGAARRAKLIPYNRPVAI